MIAGGGTPQGVPPLDDLEFPQVDVETLGADLTGTIAMIEDAFQP